MSQDRDPMAQFNFQAEVIYWRGPSPFFFVALPSPHAAEIRRIASAVTYGWGMIPVEAAIGDIAFTTSLFPKNETYLMPLKADVRRKTDVTAGDIISVTLSV